MTVREPEIDKKNDDNQVPVEPADTAEVTEEEKAPEPEEVTISGAVYTELKAKAQELDEGKDLILRRAADFENSRKRLEREKEDSVRFANETMMTAILPVLDNLERALDHIKEGDSDGVKSLNEGVSLVCKQLRDTLTRLGLQRIESKGAKFDPHVHEALGMIETDEHEDETILEELEAGYHYRDRLIRPAKVRIAKRIEQPEENKE